MDGWMDGWIDGWMDGWIDGWMDGCSAQAQVSQCHSSFHTLLHFPLFISFTARIIYLRGACSGFEPESPVNFGTWTWNACNCLLKLYQVGCSGFQHMWSSCMYWTVHHLDSWIKIDQLMSLALLFAQHVSNASTFIFRSLQLCAFILLWFDECWSYRVVRLGWCGILMQAEALVSLEPEQHTHTQSQAPEDERTSIRNMSSKK